MEVEKRVLQLFNLLQKEFSKSATAELTEVERVALMGKIMNECKLKFITYIEDTKDAGRRQHSGQHGEG